MAKSKNNIPSYEAAMEELQEIVNQLQEEAIGVDQLSTRVKRAAELIQYCKIKLRTTEEDLADLFEA